MAKHEADDSARNRTDARERILDSAEELFGRKGFDAVSTAEIAGAANVSTALIYYHFDDKESLLRNLLLRGSEVFEPLVEGLRTSGGSARERLTGYIDAWVTAVLGHESLIRILVRPLVDSDGPLSGEILSRVSRNIGVIADVIADGMKAGEFAEGDPVLAAECLFALLNTRVAAGVLNAAHLDQVSGDPHEVAQFIARVYLGGLAVDAGGRSAAC